MNEVPGQPPPFLGSVGYGVKTAWLTDSDATMQEFPRTTRCTDYRLSSMPGVTPKSSPSTSGAPALMLLLLSWILPGCDRTIDAELGNANAPPSLGDQELEGLDQGALGVIKNLRDQVLLKPDDVPLRLAFAGTLDASKLTASALVAWRQATEFAPENPRPWHHIGRLLAEQGELDGATQAFAAAVERDPGYAPTRWRMGLTLLDLGQLEGAKTAFEEALRLAPRDPSGQVGLARVALLENKVELAANLLDVLLIRHPQDGYLTKLSARIKGRQGDRAAAAALVQRPSGGTVCFQVDPWVQQLAEYRVGFAADLARTRTLLNEGRVGEARAVIEPLYRENQEHLGAEGLMVRVLLSQGQINEALSILTASVARVDHPRTRVALAQLRLSRGEAEQALANCERAIELQPGHATAHFLRAQALEALGQNSAVIAALEAAFVRGEASLEANLLYGSTLAKEGHGDEAMNAFQRATQVFPGSLQAWAMLCEVEIMTGKLEKARRTLREVESRDLEKLALPYLTQLLEAEANGQVPLEDRE
ncbi:MAG: tetratricopeptide (TPR) repeat protein [Planctomycetota bacterium]|jgi:tetratricopeptide (TPR) repeat protein